ncbi:MAG TPA: glucokinase [Gemmatimonadaceae bacterium]|nr:glucokinase [Gemmatimonadaceae bacterium]
MILACDVGGTKTNVALFERNDRAWRMVRMDSYPSHDQGSLHEIIAAFVGDASLQLEAAGFGVAGSVSGDRADTTNLPWAVDGRRLARVLGINRVSLLNDVEIQAWSLLALEPTDQVTLQAGPRGAGNLAVIAAGTGLGMSALVRGTGATRSLASEGGHADFAPSDETDLALLRYLRKRFGHVSAERVLSGPGLHNVYEFFRDRDGGTEPSWLAAAIAAGDPAATVAHAAMDGSSALAEQAVLHFLGAYGAEAGNWALRTMATGGVWLGGGVARKLLVGPAGTPDAWQARARDAFLARFRDKGRLSGILDAMAVHVIVCDEAPLLGAAHFALSEIGR